MLEQLTPQVQKVIESKAGLINTFSSESKINILKTAQIGNVKALRQQISYTNLCGDY